MNFNNKEMILVPYSPNYKELADKELANKELLDKELSKSKDILSFLKDKYGENSESFKKIQESYQDVINQYDYALSIESESGIEVTKNELNLLKKEIEEFKKENNVDDREIDYKINFDDYFKSKKTLTDLIVSNIKTKSDLISLEEYLNNNPDKLKFFVENIPGICFTGPLAIEYNNFLERIVYSYMEKLKENLKNYLLNTFSDIEDVNNIMNGIENEINKGDLCYFNLISILNNYKGKNGEKLNISDINQISKDIAHMQDIKISSDINKYLSSIGLSLEDFKYDQSNLESHEKLKNFTPEKRAEIIKNLENYFINTQKSFDISNTTFSETKAIIEFKKKGASNEEVKDFIINSSSKRGVEEYLINQESRFLKVLNDLNIFKNDATSIEVLFHSTYGVEKLIENKDKLNSDGKELLAILLAYHDLKLEREKISTIYSIKETDYNIGNNKDYNNESSYEKELIYYGEDFDLGSIIQNMPENKSIRFKKANISFSIEKKGDGFNFETSGNNIYCEDIDELNNMIDVGVYIDSLGISFLLSEINFILYTIKNHTSFGNLDASDGVTKIERSSFLTVMSRVFGSASDDNSFSDINRSKDIAQIERDFKSEGDKLGGLQYLAKKAGIIENGIFKKTAFIDKVKELNI